MITSIHAQQTFTTFQNASLVIGQTDFVSSSTTLLNGPSGSAISSKGVLAVIEQTGRSVKIWNSIPTSNGVAADVTISIPSYPEGVDWSPDGNKLIVAGEQPGVIYIWNSVPTTNNQTADVTIDLSSVTTLLAGVLITPDGKMLVSDLNNHRVLVWNSIPTVNNTAADYVIGQPNLTTTSSGTTADKMNGPWGLDMSPDGKLLISDVYNHRVLIFNTMPSSNGAFADYVIGQTGFGSNTSGTSASTLFYPIGVTVTIDGKVAVSEFSNHRVMIWDEVPQSNNEAADVVLGQPNFTTSTSYNPSGFPTANNISSAYSISSDLNGRLFLSGRDMHRVMVFGDLPSDVADLGISIIESSTALCSQSNIIYSIKLSNSGPDDATNIVSSAIFPAGYTITSATPSNGTYNQNSGYWSISNLASGSVDSLVISGTVNTGMNGQTVVSYANIINSSALDNNYSNNSANVSVTILTQTLPNNPVTNDIISCYNSSNVLTASGTGTLYWYSSLTSTTPIGSGLNFTTGNLINDTTFYVEANNGCPSNLRTPLVVTVDSEIISTITNSSPTLTADQTGASYQWLDCDNNNAEINGETGISFTAKTNGNYAVRVTVNDCSVISDCETITGLIGVEENNLSQVALFPNPTQNKVTISLIESVKVKLTDINGKILFVENNISGDFTFDLSEYSRGLYFVQVSNQSVTNTYKLVKN